MPNHRRVILAVASIGAMSMTDESGPKRVRRQSWVDFACTPPQSFFSLVPRQGSAAGERRRLSEAVLRPVNGSRRKPLGLRSHPKEVAAMIEEAAQHAKDPL